MVGGSRIDGCELVSAGRYKVDSLWLFVDGSDEFVSIHDVVELWETPSR